MILKAHQGIAVVHDSSWHSSDSSSSLVKGHKRGTKNATDANKQTSTFRGKPQSSRLLKSKGKSAAGTSRKPQPRRLFQSERSPVTTEEKAMAVRKAEAVRSTRPHFTTVMKPSHVYKQFYMTLPLEFVNQNLFQIPVTALLQVTGSSKLWKVSIFCKLRRPNGQLGQVVTSGGWVDFVMDNNLEEADVSCLFVRVGHQSQPQRYPDV
ncbi:hypothetical protein FRX31_003724 [Thalictrum thalictroides]|uniref:TF-B3 domain-containing protein n=1 Tax=Thalictrum thalictroides TaxID=46969 RepID=A0A7J6XCV2_THATH|nr:hypothetical protein FRX31_003724 [Thalictrum thalictroides]